MQNSGCSCCGKAEPEKIKLPSVVSRAHSFNPKHLRDPGGSGVQSYPWLVWASDHLISPPSNTNIEVGEVTGNQTSRRRPPE